jgi:virginiamycin B lyase
LAAGVCAAWSIEPFDIKDGPGGWLWFTNKAGNSLGRIFTGHPKPVRSRLT